MKTIVSFSGGRTSAYMAKMMLSQIKKSDLAFVFANTGKEYEETLEFVERCSDEWGIKIAWVEALVNSEKGNGTGYKVVNFQTASRNGEPFNDVIKKYGIPNTAFPHCSRELKEVPMWKWAKDNFGDKFQFAIGIRADERTRIQSHPKKIYPLVEWWPTNNRIVRDFWSKQPFDLELKDYQGNCDLCWKKSTRKILTILNENPWRAEWWINHEIEDGEYVFGRNNISMTEFLKASQYPFQKSVDYYEAALKQLEMFSEDKLDMDAESKCTCL